MTDRGPPMEKDQYARMHDYDMAHFRFARTRQQAGILGPLAPVEGDGFGRWAAKIAVSILAGGLVYVLLVCVMSVG